MAETQHPMPPGADDLQCRRLEIGRGLRRSHYAVVAASGLFSLVALAALWLGGEARHRAEDAQAAQRLAETNAASARGASTRLWEFSSHAARQERLSRAIGQRRDSLEIIREAARFQPSRELRDEALSALLLPDVGTNLVWHRETDFDYAAAYDANFEHFIQNCDHGRAIVRRAADGTVLMDEEGLGPTTPFRQFSPDGRLAAIAFRGGQIGVWDWPTTNLVAKFGAIDAPFDEPPFDFSADGRHLWLLATEKLLQEAAIETGRPGAVIALEHAARIVRLSPSRRLAAVAGGKSVEVWDLMSRARRATLALTNSIWRLAWQPGEERLAVGCYFGLFLWDLGAAHAVPLNGGNIAITDLFFDQDGGFLFVGGWNELGEIWDTRQLRRVLEPGLGHLVQLSRDQQRIATHRERMGSGIRAFLPPLGLRNWPAPPSLGQPRWGADLDPQERWLLTAHGQGWLLRDANSGKELARESCDLVGATSFSADGSNVLAWTSGGLVRWPLETASDGAVRVGPKHTFEFGMSPGPNTTCFSADRRFTARSFQGVMVVAHTDDPTQRIDIPLRRRGDSSIRLSPDGRWLITAYNNQLGWDLYDTQSGRFVRTIATNELAGAAFHPVTGQLFTCSATAWETWLVPDGKVGKRAPWLKPAFAAGFLGFAPGGRLALVKSSPSSIQLYDLQGQRDFATLDFRDLLAVHAAHWSRDGQRLFLFGNDGGVTRVDLAALRRELDRLGLNWSDEDPSRDLPAPVPGTGLANARVPSSDSADGQPSAWRNPLRLVWFVSAGLLATIGIGHYILRYQRRLFASYLETETLAAQRAGELRDTHAALAHSEKMKALGTMAAGVAHDFNNLLSVIRLSSELIEEQTQPEGATKENFEAIQHAVQRGRGIVNSMLGYARDDGQARAFAPGALISDAVALLSKPFLSGLVLQIEVDPATPELIGRRGRVEQMLLNLIVNAAEAMGGRGTLHLTAREVTLVHGCVLPPRAAARYVELSVADTGPGIPPEILPRVFEPFFTTKNKGAQHGTGLGLSMLYTMAKEDGVGVAVESQPRRGTTFRLLLPVEPASPVAQTPGASCESRSSRREEAQTPRESEPPHVGCYPPEIGPEAAPVTKPADATPETTTGRESPIAPLREMTDRQS